MTWNPFAIEHPFVSEPGGTKVTWSARDARIRAVGPAAPFQYVIAFTGEEDVVTAACGQAIVPGISIEALEFWAAGEPIATFADERLVQWDLEIQFSPVSAVPMGSK